MGLQHVFITSKAYIILLKLNNLFQVLYQGTIKNTMALEYATIILTIDITHLLIDAFCNFYLAWDCSKISKVTSKNTNVLIHP